MTKWIRGRLGRPIASLIAGLLLVSLIMPLAPPQAQAQMPDITKLFGEVKDTTPIVVLDFNNRSTYLTGMLGRTFADAVSMELMRTRTFDVRKRQLVEQVLDENNLTIPLSPQAQAMVADRLGSAYCLSGDIEDVKIRKSKEGTYAEVTLKALVISRVTGLPINGAQVVQSSSPKIGYSGSTDVLVHEALATAAYQVTQRLLDNRLPIGTVLMSPRNGEVVIKGGSTNGFRDGMECTTIRREAVTGRLRLLNVNPNESTGMVLEESKGISIGDKAVPIFEFSTVTNRYGKKAREASAIQIASFVAAGLLVSLIATQNGNNSMQDFTAPAASALADAYSLNHFLGANVITWKRPSSRVIAYIIYRDTNPIAPIAVVDGNKTFYVDTATPLPGQLDLMETIDTEIEISAEQGDLTQFNFTGVFDPTLGTLNTTVITQTDTSFSITSHRIPLQPGETCGYQMQVLYVDYAQHGLSGDPISHPDTYRLYLGTRSAVSSRVTLTEPPRLVIPAAETLPTDGVYKCERVPAALGYNLQISSNPNFAASETVNVPGRVESEAYASAFFDFNALFTRFPATTERPIYWRMGSRVEGQPNPMALSDPNQTNYVYSQANIFMLPAVPPAPLSRGFKGKNGVPEKAAPSTRGSRDRMLRR